jgi:lipopolysaccharide transport system ATP-binding protein
MAAIRNLCEKTVWLKKGRIQEFGDTFQVSGRYLSENLRGGTLEDLQAAIAAIPPDPAFRLERISIRQQGMPSTSFMNGEPIEIEIGYRVFQQTIGLRTFFDLYDEDGTLLIRSFNDDDADKMSLVEPGRYFSRATIPSDLLAPRAYELRVYGTIFNVRSIPPAGVAIPLVVEKSNGLNRGYPQEPIRSKLLPRIPWETRLICDEIVCQ